MSHTLWVLLALGILLILVVIVGGGFFISRRKDPAKPVDQDVPGKQINEDRPYQTHPGEPVGNEFPEVSNSFEHLGGYDINVESGTTSHIPENVDGIVTQSYNSPLQEDHGPDCDGGVCKL